MAFNEKARATIAAKKAAKAAQATAPVAPAADDLAAREAALKEAMARVAAREAELDAKAEAGTFHVEHAEPIINLRDMMVHPDPVPAGVKVDPAAKITSYTMDNPPPNVKIPPNLFSGAQLRLAVYGKDGDSNDPIPGYRTYWFNDIESGHRLNMAVRSGWEYVQKEEVNLNDHEAGPANTDLGNHVRRWVENGPAGLPIYAYLMKKPNWLHDLHETGPDSREQRIHQKVENELRQGTLNQQRGDGRYTQASNPRSSLPKISIDHEIHRSTKVG
jgi:hypothetical protein